MRHWRRIQKQGTWLYDAGVPLEIYILQQNFDPQYEEEYDDDKPTLNPDGTCFTVAYGKRKEGWWFSSESQTFLSEQEAILYAENVIDSIAWKESTPVVYL